MIHLTTGHPLAGMTLKHPQAGENACPLPVANTTGESLAALAGGGQGEGTNQRRRFALCSRRASALTSFIWAFHSSRSLRRALFSWTTKYVQIAPMVMVMPAAAQTTVTISVDGTSAPIWMVLGVVVAWTIVALAIFHWLMVPLINWIAEKLA